MNQAIANVDAERAILGRILMDNDALYEAGATLTPETFSLESHRRIFAQMLSMSQTGRQVDVITLMEELGSAVAEVGGVAYVSSLTHGVPLRVRIQPHLDIVWEKWALRRIQAIARGLHVRAEEQAENALSIVADFEQELLAVAAGANSEEVPFIRALYGTVDALLARSEASGRVLGYSTGIVPLDAEFGGYIAGELTYIGARPGVGKTSMMVDGLLVNAMSGVPVMGFSLEMTTEQVQKRMLSLVSGVSAWKIQKPWMLSKDDKEAIMRAKRQLEDLPIHLNDKSNHTPQQLVAKAKLAIRRHGVKLIFVDFFTRMRMEGKDYRQAANSASRMLAQLAKDEKVPVVCLSQLRRGEKDGEPRLSDLKETGNLEEDAHNVLLIHRPQEDRSWTGEDSIIIAKQREGSLGVANVFYDERRLKFVER